MSRALSRSLVLSLAACEDNPVFGPPTESMCPQGSTLTYENFGKGFMDPLLHALSLERADGRRSPWRADRSTTSTRCTGSRPSHDHVDETTAAGPAAINDGMPQTAPFPTLEERKQLGEWIACGMPEN